MNSIRDKRYFYKVIDFDNKDLIGRYGAQSSKYAASKHMSIVIRKCKVNKKEIPDHYDFYMYRKLKNNKIKIYIFKFLIEIVDGWKTRFIIDTSDSITGTHNNDIYDDIYHLLTRYINRFNTTKKSDK